MSEHAPPQPAVQFSAPRKVPPHVPMQYQHPFQAPQPQVESQPASAQVVHPQQAVDADGLPVGGFSKPPQQMQQQHAISYVTTIRNRFAKEPETYRAFLKILHTYQKEQKGIKEVLEQVSELFADHPDLLMEFTYFLPDAVQDQAKERLHRAAKESVVRRKMAAKGSASTIRAGTVPSPMHQSQQQQSQQQSSVGAKRARSEKESKERFGDAGKVPQELKDSKGASKAQPAHPGASQQANARKSARRRVEQTGPQPTTVTTFFHTSVERRLFDAIKDLLTSNTREPWGEFVRCLELFNQQLIDRTNMLALVQELFGSSSTGGQELFEEFRHLVEARSSFESKGHEVWYAIPLSEIDFSQCRKCTPSYRALPKDFPPALCSETGPHEAAVLNSQWVSIPIGSEENHSFKHMRKNQYEEALFKCEDERFEIDMVIDSNMCTIKLLEPIAEEISSFKSLEQTGDKGTSAVRLNMQLEKRSMGTIHLNAIARVYGEHGQEILELLRKNPAGTIPVVLRRLKQKDYEWRRARQELDKSWRELLDRNYEKSFDHRSFYFRQQDRRFYSPRHLVGDIKVRAGVSAPPVNNPTAIEAEEELLQSMGVVYNLHPSLVSVTALPFHLVLTFDTLEPKASVPSPHHHIIHKDVYRVLCYAVECAGLSGGEKERVVALWRDFLKVFFNMPVHYLHPGSELDDRVEERLQAWSVGTRVLCVYGTGEVLDYRPSDGVYRVRLPYGTAYLNCSAIIGAEQLPPQALHAIGVSIDQETGNEKIHNVSSTGSPSPTNVVADPCKVFFGTQTCYVFLRLYHTIFTRLLYAKQLAMESTIAYHADSGKKNAYGYPEKTNTLKSRPLYNSFIGQLLGCIDGSIDANRYEDSLRLLLGNKTYALLTLDKVVQQAAKCLNVMANDDSVNKLIGLFIYHRTRASKVDAAFYQAHVACSLSNTLEEVYRLQLITSEDGATQVGCQFLGILTGNQMEVDQAEKAPQRVIEEIQEDDEQMQVAVNDDVVDEQEEEEHIMEADVSYPECP